MSRIENKQTPAMQNQEGSAKPKAASTAAQEQFKAALNPGPNLEERKNKPLSQNTGQSAHSLPRGNREPVGTDRPIKEHVGQYATRAHSHAPNTGDKALPKSAQPQQNSVQPHEHEVLQPSKSDQSRKVQVPPVAKNAQYSEVQSQIAHKAKHTQTDFTSLRDDRVDVKSASGNLAPDKKVFVLADTAGLQNNPGASILQGLSSVPSTSPESVQAPSTLQQPATPDSSLRELVQNVADRILVSKGANGAPGEVRIQLKDGGMLQNTEVRVQVVDGRTQISFVSDHADSQNMLHQRANDLQNGLKQRLGGDVQVSVMSSDEARRENQDGHSRNRQDYDGDAADDEG